MAFFHPVCTTQNSKNLEKSVGCRDPQTNETCRGPQELSPHLFALCPLQDPREANLHPYRAHCRPATGVNDRSQCFGSWMGLFAMFWLLDAGAKTLRTAALSLVDSTAGPQ